MNKCINKIMLIVVTLSFISLALIIISAIDREDVFDKAEIVDFQDNIVKVKVGEQNGDPIIYEIEKPFYKKLKIGDYISIKNKNGVIKYTHTMNQDLMRNIGIDVLIVSGMCLYVYLGFNIIIAINLYRRSKKKKKF